MPICWYYLFFIWRTLLAVRDIWNVISIDKWVTCARIHDNLPKTKSVWLALLAARHGTSFALIFKHICQLEGFFSYHSDTWLTALPTRVALSIQATWEQVRRERRRSRRMRKKLPEKVENACKCWRSKRVGKYCKSIAAERYKNGLFQSDTHGNWNGVWIYILVEWPLKLENDDDATYAVITV